MEGAGPPQPPTKETPMKTEFLHSWRRVVLACAAVVLTTMTVRAQTLAPQFSVANDWGSGFTGDVILTNQTGGPVHGWVLTINFSGQITDVWNGVILSH